MRMPVRISVVLSAMLVTALAGCGDGDGGTGAGTPVTPEQIRSFYETQAPVIRTGILDGVSRVMELTNGGAPAGVTLVPAGGNSYNVTVDLELGGTLRGTTIPVFVALQGDPTDGLQDPDFPITLQVQNAETPFGTYSANMTIVAYGGGATVTIMGVSGTASLVDGARSEAHEFGYEIDVTFPNIPVYGWEYIEVTGAGTAAFDVCYRFNEQAGQYVRVWGTAGGAPFDFEFGGPPAKGSFPCEE